jgi:hypothetical protein
MHTQKHHTQIIENYYYFFSVSFSNPEKTLLHKKKFPWGTSINHCMANTNIIGQFSINFAIKFGRTHIRRQRAKAKRTY